MNIHIEYQPPQLTFDAFHRVDAACFPHEPIPPDDFRTFGKNDFWAAFDSTTLVGYCYVIRRPDMSWLSRLCVCSEYRQFGIATQMMRIVIDHARQIGLPDIVLYEKFGFHPVESAYQFVFVDPDQINSNRTSKSITAVPILDIEETSWPQFPREWTDMAAVHRPPNQYVFVFRDPSGKNMGYCRFSPQFPGCFPFTIEQPQEYLLPALRQLHRYALPGKESIILTFSDDELAEACRILSLKLNYQLYKMFRYG